MRIIGIGIDIVSVSRIKTLLKKNGRKFVEKIFTKAEQAYCDSKKDSAARYAGRFAVKEAVMKAAGTGWSENMSWLDIETKNDKNGKLSLSFAGKGVITAKKLGVAEIFVSISHTDETSVAQVILAGN